MLGPLRDLYSLGFGVLRQAADRAFAPGAWSALPTATIDHRGALGRTEGGAGVNDALRFAEKDTADAYQWALVPTLPTDPGADRLLFWDESVNAFRYLTAGSGLTITGTTIDTAALATGYTVGPYLVFTARDDNVTGTAAMEWTNMPSGNTELYGVTVHRKLIDLTHLTEFKFICHVTQVGFAAADLRLQYSTDLAAGAAFSSMDNTTDLLIDATGWVQSAWTAIPAGALAVVQLRVRGQDGNGAADPQLTTVAVQFRGEGVQGPAGSGGGGSLVDILMLGGM
jgi:hypothetical protein